MFIEIKKIYAILERDIRILFSYKLALFFSLFSTIFTVFYLVLFGRMFETRTLSILQPYGGDFIAYVLMGTIAWEFLMGISTAGSNAIMSEMGEGTIEPILCTPTSLQTIIVGYIISGSLMSMISIVILLMMGIWLFHANISMNIYGLVILGISSFMMVGISFMVAGLTIQFKNIGPMFSLFQSISMLFSGVYFPIEVLPKILQPIAYCIPFYYPIMGLRTALMPGQPLSVILNYMVILSVLSIIFLITGNYVLRWGLNRARKQGTIAFY